MKSQVNALLHVAQGLLTDVRAVYPALEDSLSKDWKRLTLYCQARGPGVFTLDLPHLYSLLLVGLETGRLTSEGPFSRMVSKEVRVPRLFSGLWLRVFDKNACLKREVDVNALFFLKSILGLGGKIELDCSDDRIQAKIGEYHDIERRLRKPSLLWECDDLLHPPAGDSESREAISSPRDCSLDGCDRGGSHILPGLVPEGELEQVDVEDPEREVRCNIADLSALHLVQAVDHIYPGLSDRHSLFSHENRDNDTRARAEDVHLLNKIQHVADLVFSAIGPVNPIVLSDEWESEGRGTGFRHGPGAVAEKRKNWEKSEFLNWPHKLGNVFPFSLCGTYAGSGLEHPLNHEKAATLHCVPKTAKGPRLIAAEPTAHQYCQQLLLRFLTDRCRHLFGGDFIDFKRQCKSGALVIQASLDRKLATVDLSDASDRLSCWTVERMIRTNPSLLRALHAARTRYVWDEISDIPGFLPLRKFASQGTATTFPIMTIVMFCIALAMSLKRTQNVTLENIWALRNQVRVYGDDIIVPVHGYTDLVRAMELLELKVNVAKSYVTGGFRESCGVDGFCGYDITVVRPKTLVPNSPASCQAVVDTSNNLFNKGLFNAAHAAEDLLPSLVRQYLRVVGIKDAGRTGLSSFCGSDESHLKTRWNHGLHRYEVRTWGTFPKVQKRPVNDAYGMLDFFTRGPTAFNPRVVSEYRDVRNTKGRVLWEPQNAHARVHDSVRR